MSDRTDKNLTEELAHFSWCMMVAVSIARQDGKIASGLQEHMFIMKWLVNAQKRKLFPKTLSQSILWLQREGKSHGPTANLYKQVESIWLSNSKYPSKTNDLLRFANAFSELQKTGWVGYVLTDEEWINEAKTNEIDNIIYIHKNSLHESFNQDGQFIKNLELKLKGDIGHAQSILKKILFRTELSGCIDGLFILSLIKK